MAQTLNVDVALLQTTVGQFTTKVVHLTASRYLTVAGYTILIYDHILTLADEVDLIWKQPMNVVSVLFLINRYIPPLVIGVVIYDKTGLSTKIPDSVCKSWFWVEGITQVISHMLTHIIVALRLSALYGRNKIVDTVLFTTGVVYLTSTIAIGIAPALSAAGSFKYNRELHICLGKIGRVLLWIWFPALMYECLLFGMTVYKAYEHNKRNIRLPITHILYRDGFLYFLVITFCAAFNLVTWSALPETLMALAKYFTFSLINVMSAKLVLNLRGLQHNREYPFQDGHSADHMHPSNGNPVELQNVGVGPKPYIWPFVFPATRISKSPEPKRPQRAYYFNFDSPKDERPQPRWGTYTREEAIYHQGGSSSDQSLRRSSSSRKTHHLGDLKRKNSDIIQLDRTDSQRLEVRVEVSREVMSEPSRQT